MLIRDTEVALFLARSTMTYHHGEHSDRLASSEPGQCAIGVVPHWYLDNVLSELFPIGTLVTPPPPAISTLAPGAKPHKTCVRGRNRHLWCCHRQTPNDLGTKRDAESRSGRVMGRTGPVRLWSEMRAVVVAGLTAEVDTLSGSRRDPNHDDVGAT